MPKDPRAAEVAAQVRRDAEALLAAWGGYTSAEAKLDSIVQCASSWGGEAQCDLLAGHTGLHRGRLLGTQVVAQW